MNEHQTDELTVTDVDEWLDDAEMHAACTACTPPEQWLPGSLVIAHCGALYRLRHGRRKNVPLGVCEACRQNECGESA